MTAHHHQSDGTAADRPAEQATDPIGPIKMPLRSRIGVRAFALVGAASVLSVGIIETTDLCGTYTTTISHH